MSAGDNMDKVRIEYRGVQHCDCFYCGAGMKPAEQLAIMKRVTEKILETLGKLAAEKKSAEHLMLHERVVGNLQICLASVCVGMLMRSQFWS